MRQEALYLNARRKLYKIIFFPIKYFKSQTIQENLKYSTKYVSGYNELKYLEKSFYISNIIEKSV